MPSPRFPISRVEILMFAETILYNAKVATNGVPSFVDAVAITEGEITSVGTDDEIMRLRGPRTRAIDARRRTVIPGLNDSHMHPIRGGLNYNLELRWDGVPSLADALRMLAEQAARTPAPQWVRVIADGRNFNSRNVACRRSTKSMRRLRRHPSSSCICTTARC